MKVFFVLLLFCYGCVARNLFVNDDGDDDVYSLLFGDYWTCPPVMFDSSQTLFDTPEIVAALEELETQVEATRVENNHASLIIQVI